jgi:hypothetical protein
MGQNSSWEANGHSASQEIQYILRNSQVQYTVHKSLSLIPIVSQMHAVHTFPPYFPKIHSYYIGTHEPM